MSSIHVTSLFSSCTDESLTEGLDQRCVIVRRGGGEIMAELDPLEGSYCERVLDDTSVAEVHAEAGTLECCDQLNDIFIGMDLHWYRDEELIWAGPITNIKWSADTVHIQAADLTAWWSWRLLPTVKFRSREASEVVREVHRLSMLEDPVENFNLQVKKTTSIVTHLVYQKERRTASDVINELAEYAVDYTAYGQTVFIGPSDFLPDLPYTLTDRDWVVPPSIEARGPFTGFATRIVATGSAGDYIHVATASAGVRDLYGLIERTIDFPHITTRGELKQAAETFLDLYSQPYFINFSNSNPVLLPGAAVPLRILIPGVVVMVESGSTCKKLRMRMRILNVTNYADGAVALTLEPAGTTGSILSNG